MKILAKMVCLAVCAGAAYGQTPNNFLDFEDAEKYGGDDALITDEYFANRGFKFSGMAGNSASDAERVQFSFEKTGRDGTDGFWTSGGSGRDEAMSYDLGNYFMKAGTGNLSYNKAKYFKMTIEYQKLSLGASGEIWDIDGPEQYRVTAFDKDGGQIGTLLSPHGGLDGHPWYWSFDVGGGKQIASIDIEAVGTGTLRGFAFDNFEAFAAPLPPALPLGCAGVCMIALVSSRNKRRKPVSCHSMA